MKEEIKIFKNKKINIILKKREKPIPEFEQLAQAFDDLKKEILKMWLAKLVFWIVDRLSQMIEWVRRIKRKDC